MPNTCVVAGHDLEAVREARRRRLPPRAPQGLGANRLWIDRVPAMSQAEVWLEVVTNDFVAASAHLAAAGVVRCDEIEWLPEGMAVFWIASPAGIVHFVVEGAGV